MRPITESQGFIDITKGNSEDFNKLVKSFSRDLTTVFNITNENEAIINRNMDIVIQENIFLYRKTKELEEKLNTVMAAVEKVKGNASYYKTYKTFFSMDGVEKSTVYHDVGYGVITLPYRDAQKASIGKYPKSFLLSNMDITLEYEMLDGNGAVKQSGSVTLANDPELINILDQNESSFWVKNLTTSDITIEKVNFKLKINMPMKILSTLFVNSIGIKPHPIYSLSLNDISYTDANTKIKQRIPTYPKNTVNGVETPISIDQLDNTKFIFPVVTTTQLEFDMSQPYYMVVNGMKQFTIGFRGIDIENISIVSETESFITKLEIPGDGRYFSKVLEPTVYPIVEGVNYGNLITHELLYDTTSETSLPFGSELGSNVSTLYIKTTIRRDGEVIPAIKGIEFNYLPKTK